MSTKNDAGTQPPVCPEARPRRWGLRPLSRLECNPHSHLFEEEVAQVAEGATAIASQS
jgi:hypothetical protein